MTRRCPPARVWLALLLALVALAWSLAPGGGRGHAAGPPDAGPGAGADVSGVPPCGELGPHKDTLPPHAYTPGDPICYTEASGTRRPDAPISNPHRAATPLAASQSSAAATSGWNQRNAVVTTDYIGLAGLYVCRRVTNPQLVPSDHMYHTMHAGGTGGRWIEIGWAKFWTGTREIFVVTPDGYFGYASKYPISTGQTICVQLDDFAGNGSWRALLWWGGTWVWLKTGNIGATLASDENITVEVFSDDLVWPALPITWVDDAQLYLCILKCNWVKWDTYVPQTTYWSDLPYHIHWTNYYYKWYTHTDY